LLFYSKLIFVIRGIAIEFKTNTNPSPHYIYILTSTNPNHRYDFHIKTSLKTTIYIFLNKIILFFGWMKTLSISLDHQKKISMKIIMNDSNCLFEFWNWRLRYKFGHFSFGWFYQTETKQQLRSSKFMINMASLLILGRITHASLQDRVTSINYMRTS
jgi:hypothetical protein